MDPFRRREVCAVGSDGPPPIRLFRSQADYRPVATAAFDVLPSDRTTRVVIHFFREEDHDHGPDCLVLPDLPGYRACIRLGPA